MNNGGNARTCHSNGNGIINNTVMYLTQVAQLRNIENK